MAPGYSLSGGAGGAASTGPLTGGTSSFDASGFNVNFGSGSASSGLSLGKYAPWLIGGVVVVFVVWRVTRGRK